MNPSFFQKHSFGTLPDGREVSMHILSNRQGMEMCVLDYGCTITSLKAPDARGRFGNVVLGFDTLRQYLNSPHYMGCIIGRCAGRIAHGRLDIRGHTYALPINQSPHHLHGGPHGFHSQIWETQPYENEDGTGICFTYLSPDGEEGYPGNLSAEVRYFLAHDNTLLFHYTARTDRMTAVNMTQHSYFNLQAGGDTILKHALAINADHVLPLSETKVPTGEIRPVDGTIFDVRQPIILGQLFMQPDPQLKLTNGLDHCFVIRPGDKPLSHAALLLDMDSGRRMDVYTTSPGLQVYTGNALDGAGQDGKAFGPYSGIALETQHFPDAPHHAQFPSILLHPDETYESVTQLRFSLMR